MYGSIYEQVPVVWVQPVSSDTGISLAPAEGQAPRLLAAAAIPLRLPSTSPRGGILTKPRMLEPAPRCCGVLWIEEYGSTAASMAGSGAEARHSSRLAASSADTLSGLASMAGTLIASGTPKAAAYCGWLAESLSRLQAATSLQALVVGLAAALEQSVRWRFKLDSTVRVAMAPIPAPEQPGPALRDGPASPCLASAIAAGVVTVGPALRSSSTGPSGQAVQAHSPRHPQQPPRPQPQAQAAYMLSFELAQPLPDACTALPTSGSEPAGGGSLQGTVDEAWPISSSGGKGRGGPSPQSTVRRPLQAPTSRAVSGLLPACPELAPVPTASGTADCTTGSQASQRILRLVGPGPGTNSASGQTSTRIARALSMTIAPAMCPPQSSTGGRGSTDWPSGSNLVAGGGGGGGGGRPQSSCRLPQLRAQAFVLAHSLLEQWLAAEAASAPASQAVDAALVPGPRDPSAHGGAAGAGHPAVTVVADTARHVQDVHLPSRDVLLLMTSPQQPSAAGLLAGGGGGGPAVVASGVRSLALVCMRAGGGGGSEAVLGLYLCFPSSLPEPLLRDVGEACQSLLHHALGPVLRQRLCGPLAGEVGMLASGVPGRYLVLPPTPPPPTPPAPTSYAAPRVISPPTTLTSTCTLTGTSSAPNTHPGARPGGAAGAGPTSSSAGSSLPQPASRAEAVLPSSRLMALAWSRPWAQGAGPQAEAGPSSLDTAGAKTPCTPNHSSPSPLAPSRTSDGLATAIAAATAAAAAAAAEAAAAKPRGSALPPRTGSVQLLDLPNDTSFGTTMTATTAMTGTASACAFTMSCSGGRSGGGAPPPPAAYGGVLDLMSCEHMEVDPDPDGPGQEDSLQGLTTTGEATLVLLERAPSSCGPALEALLGSVAATSSPMALDPAGASGSAGRRSSCLSAHPTTAHGVSRTAPLSHAQQQIRESTRRRNKSTHPFRFPLSPPCGGAELDDLWLAGMLGSGAGGLVLHGCLGSVPVAVKLLELPEEVGTGARAQRHTHAHAQQQAGLRPGQRLPAGARAQMARQAQARQAQAQVQMRRALMRNARELAIHRSLACATIAKVFAVHSDVYLWNNASGSPGAVLGPPEAPFRLRREPPPPGNGPAPACMAVVMELGDRGSLAEALTSRAFPRWLGVYLTLLDIAMALRYLHSRRLVHRDVKPAKCLLVSCASDPRGWTCKLCDFGFVLPLDIEDAEPAAADGALGGGPGEAVRYCAIQTEACGT
ncbi:hypothetical protein HYH03_004304 [Edaphochlamys debaryana]|uniref:Protein kinase domain-containing protein n=1 Tax=Edaphochlamys debaryana TaxID=47281 RepID=A0A835Y9R2_9CHLO|nr:hypothetical protein HYH03_004304 [Edaphochlamys debaryana]|eukprot:KAG2497557.1 hypothetical protein HYH03_004304 [Edaphochlamys debaryana]